MLVSQVREIEGPEAVIQDKEGNPGLRAGSFFLLL